MNAYIIPGMDRPPQEFKSPEEAIDYVCKLFAMSREQMLRRTRKREIIEARQTAMALVMLRFQEKTSHRILAEEFGYDRTTLINAVKTISDIYTTDKKYRQLTRHLFAGYEWPQYKRNI